MVQDKDYSENVIIKRKCTRDPQECMSGLLTSNKYTVYCASNQLDLERIILLRILFRLCA